MGCDPPRVGVIIPMHQARATIERALESLRRQSPADWAAIVIDDGSSDAGPELVRRVAAGDPRIRLIRQGNRGLAGARNRGLDEIRAQFVLFLDADDWILPGSLDALIRAASATGAVCGRHAFFDEVGSPLGLESSPPWPEMGLEHLLRSNRIAPHAHLVRRDLIGDLRFDARFPGVEDWDLWVRLAEHGVRWRSVDRTVAAYRLRDQSMSKDAERMFASARGVVESACRRAIARGEAPETSRGRRDRAIASQSLFYATVAAVRAQDDVARRILGDRNARGVDAGDGAEAGDAAYWAVVYGRGAKPTPTSARDWFPRVCDLWMDLPGADRDAWLDAARSRLAMLMVDPGDVACALLDRADAHGPITLIGLGHNGRLLARAALERGLPLLVRDDRPCDGDPLLDDPGVRLEPMNSPLTSDRGAIITPGDDEALAARFPGALRWTHVHAQMARRVLKVLSPVRTAA